MLGTTYICALHVTTAGLQGSSLGSDEEEVVLLAYVIFDMTRNKIVGLKQYLVKPTTMEDNSDSENVNVLSEQITTETRITEELVKDTGVPLSTAVEQFDSYVRSLQIDPSSPLFRFVTDGQLPLRQCLHPEACSKNIDLPEYYNTFHDLRKDFRTFYNVPNDQELSSITHLVKYLGMTHEEDPQFYVTEIKDMINIVHRLIADGHCFSTPEVIQIKLEPGICWKDDEVDSNCVVRARGLPWQSSDQDIAKFFRGLNIEKGGVALCLSPQGRRNGEALVRFVSKEHRDMALKRHKHHIGNRYIEVYKASGEDFVNVAGGNSNEAQAFLTKGASVIVRMRGLPYDCTAKQVLEFFESGGEEKSCKVMDEEEGVLFVKKPDGRATGDAFVLFADEEDSPKALSKHRELIGTRYIELFRSTTAEVQQVLNRSMDPKTYEAPQQTQISLAPPHLQPVQFLPQHIITSGTRKDCIRLRGLPYEASVEHILEFLGEHAKNIVFQGVHMVYNAQGQPSGEAFIQMDSEQSAYAAAQMRHHRYMYFGKKQRYIEVFQCSGEDMNMVITGGLPATNSPIPPVGKTLLSPGMLSTPTILTNPHSAIGTPVPATTLLQHPTGTAALAWDPVAAQVAAIQMQQALAQAQVLRSQQESVWLLNQLAAQQQLQLAALTAGKNTSNWPDLNSAPATMLPALPPPPSITPVSSVSSTTTASTPSTSKGKTIALPSTAVYPASASIHIPQTSLSAANTPGQSVVFINIPRIGQSSQSCPTKISSPSSPSPTPTTITLTAQNPIMTPTSQYPASFINLKRTWEQAFPAEVVAAAAAAQNSPVKRQYAIQTNPTSSTIFSVPPPQLSQSIAAAQQPIFSFPTAQYYPASYPPN